MNAKTLIVTLAVIGLTASAGVTATNAASNTGNGNGSKNTATETRVRKTNVGQVNTALQGNLVGLEQNSGGNKANKNTGGAVTNTSGRANVEVGVGNAANENGATISNCDCDALSPATAANTGNGNNSTNKATVKHKTVTNVTQSNVAVQNNTVLVGQNSGNNTANSNTDGDVTIGSGNISATIVAENVANSNTLVIE